MVGEGLGVGGGVRGRKDVHSPGATLRSWARVQDEVIEILHVRSTNAEPIIRNRQPRDETVLGALPYSQGAGQDAAVIARLQDYLPSTKANKI